MPEQKEIMPSWPYGITGRRVDFTDGLPLSWGIEIDTPFEPEVKETLLTDYGIRIPGRVNKIKFLTLNPQESLPKNLRNIYSSRPSDLCSSLENLADCGDTSMTVFFRRKEVENCFLSVFAQNKAEISRFNSLISKSKGDTLLIAEGHGWASPLALGEQDDYGPWLLSDRPMQKQGNNVEATDIIKRYNKPAIYAGIILVVCNEGKKKVKALDIPLAYGIGEVGSEEALSGLVKTMVVPPRKR